MYINYKQGKRQDNLLDSYMESIKNSKHLGAKEQIDLVRRAQKGDMAARNKVIESNLRFVVFFIEKEYKDSGAELCDLVSAGNIGLIEAIKTFDTEKGNNFLTYARWKIRGEIKDYFRKTKRCDSLNEENVTECNSEDVFEYNARVREEEYENCFLCGEDMEIKNNKTLVSYFMKDLDDRQKYILTRFYGLDGKEAANLDVIARDLGISIEYVRKIKDNTIKKMTCRVVEKPELQKLYFQDDIF